MTDDFGFESLARWYERMVHDEDVAFDLTEQQVLTPAPVHSSSLGRSAGAPPCSVVACMKKVACVGCAATLKKDDTVVVLGPECYCVTCAFAKVNACG